MRFFANNPNPDAYYEPNSFDGPKQDDNFREPPLKTSGDADRYDHRQGNDDYTQAGNLFRLFDDNIAAAMQGVPETIIRKQLEHFYKADPAYGAGVATALGLSDTVQQVA